MPPKLLQSDAVGDVLADKFVVLRTLGAGGMGVVYEVEHKLTGHRRALKVLRVDSEDIARRTLREATVASQLENPHVVETYDAGHLPDGRVYILMELLHGVTFSQFLRERSILPLGLACAILSQVCDGLAAAHREGIVHRDIKPANIFIKQVSNGVDTKLLDFGVSKFSAAPSELTEEGQMIGTPVYMAPEQLRAQPIDGKADIFSVGVVLYLALTGRRPFPTGTIAELAIAIVRGEYTPLDVERPDLPLAFVSLVHRALEQEPTMRPSAVQMRDALLAFVAPDDGIVLSSRAPDGGPDFSASAEAVPIQNPSAGAPAVAVSAGLEPVMRHDAHGATEGQGAQPAAAVVEPATAILTLKHEPPSRAERRHGWRWGLVVAVVLAAAAVVVLRATATKEPAIIGEGLELAPAAAVVSSGPSASAEPFATDMLPPLDAFPAASTSAAVDAPKISPPKNQPKKPPKDGSLDRRNPYP